MDELTPAKAYRAGWLDGANRRAPDVRVERTERVSPILRRAYDRGYADGLSDRGKRFLEADVEYDTRPPEPGLAEDERVPMAHRGDVEAVTRESLALPPRDDE